MSTPTGSVSLFRRIPGGGMVDVRYRTDHRVQLFLDTNTDVAIVLDELDALRTQLTQLAGLAPAEVGSPVGLLSPLEGLPTSAGVTPTLTTSFGEGWAA